jgi:HEAT repeat protein
LTSLLGNPSTSLVLAAVRALEFVGTGQTIKPMQRLAKRGAYGVIRAEAARALPILEERRKQEQASLVLLRGSAPPAASADELLRAAAGEPQTPPEQLLRPGQER